MSGDLIQEQTKIEQTLRGINPETYEFWSYRRGTASGGELCHVANHYKDGQLSGQKLRFPGKKFSVKGKMDSLYGRWLWSKGGKMVVVTEGELDALSVSQVQNNKWPVVSIANGAQAAPKAFKESIDWLEAFDSVVIMFDNDEPGREAALACAKILSPGKAKIATLPLKDANDMLVAGRDRELMSAIWNAAPYRPDGIVALSDIIDKALKPTERGLDWFLPTLTALTFGRRRGETYFLGAGTGVGKTDWLTQSIAFDLVVLGQNVGVLFLEQGVVETGVRIAGKYAGRRFHVPDGAWTAEELKTALTDVEQNGKLYLYDNFGACEWNVIKERITYMAQAQGCSMIYLDHLTALAAAAEDERTELERITSEIAMLAKRLSICIHVVSHLATPESGSHEEGARVTIRQFKGSRAIGFWAHFMFGLERNQQAENEEDRQVTTFRILKDRYTGQSTGKTIELAYDHSNGLISECVREPAVETNEQVEF